MPVRRLNDLGYVGQDGKPLETKSGVFGINTLFAVNAFKDATLPGGNKDSNRGVVGPTTWDYLFSSKAVYGPSHSNATSTTPNNKLTSFVLYAQGSGINIFWRRYF